MKTAKKQSFIFSCFSCPDVAPPTPTPTPTLTPTSTSSPPNSRIDISIILEAAKEIKSKLLRSDSVQFLLQKLIKDTQLYVEQPGKSPLDLEHLQLAGEIIIISMEIVVMNPEQFPVSISILRVMNGIYIAVIDILSHYDNAMVNAEKIQGWRLAQRRHLSSILSLSRNIGKSDVLSKTTDVVSVNLLLLESTKLEVMALAFPDPCFNGKAVQAMLNVLEGGVSSILKMSLDAKLIRGLLSGASLSVDSIKRNRAAFIAKIFSSFESLVRVNSRYLKRPFEIKDLNNVNGSVEKLFLDSFYIEGWDEPGRKKETVKYIRSEIQRWQHFFDEYSKSSLQRWEVFAAFAVMLTEIYLSLANKMKTLCYEYCLSCLCDDDQANKDRKDLLVYVRDSREANEQSESRKAEKYRHEIDQELQSVCNSLTNTWIRSLQQMKRQPELFPSISREANEEKDHEQSERDETSGSRNFSPQNTNSVASNSAARQIDDSLLRVKIQISQEDFKFDRNIKVEKGVFEQFEAIYDLCEFIFQGLREGSETEVFHFSLSALLQYGDVTGVQDIDMGSMMVQIVEWATDLKDFITSTNPDKKFDEWLQRCMTMVWNEGHRVFEKLQIEGERKMNQLKNAFADLIHEISRKLTNQLKESVVKKLNTTSVMVFANLSTEITKLVILAEEVQRIVKYFGNEVGKVLFYMEKIDSVLSKLVPSKVFEILNSSSFKAFALLQSLKKLSQLDPQITESTEQGYLAALDSINHHYTSLRIVFEVSVKALSLASGLQFKVTVEKKDFSVQKICEKLRSFEVTTMAKVAETVSEIRQHSDRPKEMFENLKLFLSEKFIKDIGCCYNVLVQNAMDFCTQELAKVNDAATQFSPHFGTLSEAVAATQFSPHFGTLSEAVVSAKDTFSVAKSIVTTTQAKCVELSDAIGKSIAGLKLAKSKLDQVTNRTWVLKTPDDLNDLVESLVVLKDQMELAVDMNSSQYKVGVDLWGILQRSSKFQTIKCNGEEFEKTLLREISYVLTSFRDAAVVELEAKVSEGLNAFKAIANSAKKATGDLLHIDIEDSGLDGLLSSVAGLTKSFIKDYSSKYQLWRVRDVTAFCFLRIISGSAIHSAASRQLIVKRKVFESSGAIRHALSRGDAEGSPSLQTLNEIIVGKSDPFISLSSFQEIDTELSEEKAANAKRAWLEEENAIYESILTRLKETDVLREAAEAQDDPMKKQEMVARCRLESKSLQQAANNIKDVAKKLDIVVTFLSNIEGQLISMDKKLDTLQQDIAVMRDELRRFVGRPPLDVIGDWSIKYLRTVSTELQREVYVEGEVCRAGPKNDFKKVKDLNESFLVSAAFEKFMKSDKNILLLSGLAGSGKSKAIEKMKTYILDKYSMKKKEENVTVILLPVSLPSLVDPLGGIFEEGMKRAYDGALSMNQIHELDALIRQDNFNTQMVFFLDAYDELRPDYLWKNLWQTNNLDQYTNQNSKLPKVVITSRSELFSGQEKTYLDHFSPKVDGKDDVAAKELIDEFRFIEFRDKISDYQRQYVALHWRDAFLQRFGDHGTKKYVVRRTIIDAHDSTAHSKEELFEADDLSQLHSVYMCSTVEDRNSSVDSSLLALENNEWRPDENLRKTMKEPYNGLKSEFPNHLTACSIVSLLIGLFGINHTDKILMKAIFEFVRFSTQSETLQWSLREYNEKFKCNPELLELSATPFLVEVVTKILPTLQSDKLRISDLKSSLASMYGMTVAEIIWQELKKYGIDKLDGPKLDSIVIDVLKHYQSDPMSSSRRINTITLPDDVPARTELDKRWSTDADYVEIFKSGVVFCLRNPPTRRNNLYERFTEWFINREVEKLMVNRSMVSSVTLPFEANELARRLALYLTHNSKSALERREVSDLFVRDKSERDIFFDRSALAVAARSAAPLKESSSILGFIHKSIQEYYVADMIVLRLMQAVRDCNATSIRQLLQWNSLTESCPAISLKDRKLYLELIQNIQSGPLGYLSLQQSNESAVVDFVADYLLGNVDVMKSFQLVHKACYQFVAKLDINDESLKLVRDNIWDICTMKMPRRNNGTLLHEAASEGSESLIQFISEVIESRDSPLSRTNAFDSVDSDNKTSLFRAQEKGHLRICKLLLEQGASQIIKAKVDPLFSIRTGVIDFDNNMNSCSQGTVNCLHQDMKFVVGCPLAAVDISKGDNACVMYEVEIENEGTFGHQLRIGWMHDQQQNYLLNAVKNVGDEYGTIAMDRFSRKCYLSGSIGIDLSPRSEDFLLDSYSSSDLIRSKEISSEAWRWYKDETKSPPWEEREKQNDRPFNADEFVYRRDAVSQKSVPLVFGAAIDCTKRQLLFAVNGSWRMVDPIIAGDFFSSALLTQKTFLFPAVSCVHGIVKFRFNIGYHEEFKYPITSTSVPADNNLRELNRPVVESSMVNYYKPVSAINIGTPAVIQAADGNRIAIFKTLIQHATDVKKLDEIIDFVNSTTGDTVIHYMAKFEYQEGFRAVIKLFPTRVGEIFRNQNHANETALMTLCTNNSHPILNDLLKEKISSADLHLHLRDVENESTALMKACRNGSTEIVDLLLSKSLISEIDWRMKDKYGMTALMHACNRMKSEPIVLSLLKTKSVTSEDLKLQDKMGKTALMFACDKGLSTAVKSMIEIHDLISSSDLEKADLHNKKTAFMFACYNDHIAIAQSFIESGLISRLALELQDCMGKTALMYACSNIKSEPIVLSLLQSKAVIPKDLQLQDEVGKTALMYACEKGLSEAVKSMIAIPGLLSSRDLEIVDSVKKKKTALIYACENGHTDIVLSFMGKKDLVSTHALSELKDVHGKTALMYAQEKGLMIQMSIKE